jgi:hypothetical protein
LKASWQRQVLVSGGYRELGMFEDAAQALEEIEPEDKTRNEDAHALRRIASAPSIFSARRTA